MLGGDSNSRADDDPDPQDEGTDPVPTEPFPLDDTITGTSADDSIDGGTGSDVLNGGDGNDRIFGGEIATAPAGTGQNDTIFGGEGGDTVNGGFGYDLIYGGTGDDNLQGLNGQDTLHGDGGSDTIGGSAGNDLLYGGGSNDTLAGSEGNDLLYGDDGDDYFAPQDGQGEDTIYGGGGADLIFEGTVPFYDGPNISVIDGGGGGDTIHFNGGSTITGGGGDDALSLWHNQTDAGPSLITDFDPRSDSLTVYLDGVTASTGSEFRLEDWANGQGADLFYGDELLAEIAGAQGLDPSTIALNVSLDQNGGDISFTDGENGTLIYGNHSDNDIFGGGGDDYIIAGDQPVFGSTSNYQGGEDLVDGGAGNDTLSGSGGTFYVGPEGDTDAPVPPQRFQEIARDTLLGGDGDDVLMSENGNDLTGGAGADVFGISHLTGEDAVGFTLDPTVITDFNPAEDEIVLTNGSIPPGAVLSIMVWPNGAGSDILAGGTVVAEVTGGQGLTVADIRLENYLIESYINA